MDIKTLTPEQAAGQRILPGFNGLELNDSLRFLIDTLKVGGLILFKRNIESPNQVTDLCHQAHAFAKACGQPPLFIAIDQEGGTVARLPPPFTRIPGASELASPEEAADYAKITASELSRIGVNMNFAPVMDIAPKNFPSVMAKRSYGDTPFRVSAMGCEVIRTLQDTNILAVAKHFPGIGRTTLDSHLDRPVFDTERQALEDFDLIPFKSAIETGVSGIMLSHILYNRIDPNWPASLSPVIANEILRKDLKYDGLVMTDDVDMGAIQKYYDMETVIGQADLAGIDLVLICHEGPDQESAFRHFLRMVGEKPIPETTDGSLERIFRAKARYLAW